MSENHYVVLTAEHLESIRAFVLLEDERLKEYKAARKSLLAKIAKSESNFRKIDDLLDRNAKGTLIADLENFNVAHFLAQVTEDCSNEMETENEDYESEDGEYDAENPMDKLRQVWQLPASVSASGVHKPSGIQIIAELAAHIKSKAETVPHPAAEAMGHGPCMCLGEDSGFIEYDGVPYVAITAAIGPNGEDQMFECPAAIVVWCDHKQSAPPAGARWSTG